MSEQRLPARLRDLRKSRNMSQKRLAASLNVSKSLVTSFETGRLIPQDDTAKSIDALFGTGEEIQKAAKNAREDRQPWLRSWVENEKRALLLRTWEPILIPGLLQCESYMRAVISAAPVNAGKVEELVAARKERQAATIFRDKPVALSAIIGEIALRRGPRDILKEQLAHLLEMSERPHIRIRVILAESEGLHVGLGGGFVIATLPEGRRLAYMDDQLVGHMVSNDGDLDALELAWEEIDGLALSVAQSREVISRVLNEHN